jgi:MFS family permease
VSVPSARLRRLQYAVVAQLSIIGIINYMDQATLSIANPLVRQDMGLSVSQMGLLLSAFPLTYALAQLPLGLIIDRLGSRLRLGLGLVVWSLAQCFGGPAGSASQLWASRFLLGIGEAPTLPSSTKVVRRWYKPSKRGTPVGIFTGATHLGQAIAASFLTLLMVVLGWRWMFIIMGLAGFVSAALWFALCRDPADASLAASDHAHLAEGETLRDVGNGAPPQHHQDRPDHHHPLYLLHGGQRLRRVVIGLADAARRVAPEQRADPLLGRAGRAAISLVGAAIYWLVPRGPITADELAEAPAGVVPVS